MNSIKFSILILAIICLGACNKDTPVVAETPYTGAPTVTFDQTYAGYQKVNINLGNAWIPFDFDIKLTNTTKAASDDIVVKLVKDNNPIYEYNTANGTTLSGIPSSAYRFDTTNVVIKKGARTAKVHFEVNPALLDLSYTYAFGVSIYSVSGAGVTVSPNVEETSLVVELGALNQWDGAYKSSDGYFYHPTAPRAIPAGTDKYCFTTGINTVATELGDFNGVVQPGAPYYITLEIDANNNVTVKPGPGPAPSTSPVVNLATLPAPYTAFAGSNPSIYTNKWDPAAKKFYLRYGYMGTNGYRVVEEVLTKQ